MKVVLTGSNGQLGKTISLLKPKDIELICLNKKDLDLKDNYSCYEMVSNLKPDWLINSAAYTAVDLAEENIKSAFEINFEAPKQFAKAIKKFGGNFLQISTDFVFDGNSNKPYVPSSKRNPINIYGRSKAAAEEIIEEILGNTTQSIILRTSWLMSPFNNNFASTISNLLKNKKKLSIVEDQIGSPTSCASLANTIWRILNFSFSKKSTYFPKIMHWSNKGEVSWYQIAKYILEVSKEKKFILNNPIIKPIKTSDYKFKAIRPKYSVLDSSLSEKLLNLENISWENAIRDLMYYKFQNKF